MSIIRYVVVSVAAGVLFGVMDGLINANPLARRLFAAYAPIAKTSINVAAGVVIDLVYGFFMAGAFLLLYRGLPGKSGFAKGLSFAVMVWFFRVVMAAATTWMTLEVPAATMLYSVAVGLAEMLVLGVFLGLTLRRPSVS